MVQIENIVYKNIILITIDSEMLIYKHNRAIYLLTINDNESISKCIEEHNNNNYYPAIICLLEYLIEISKRKTNEGGIIKGLYYLSMSYYKLSDRTSSPDYYYKAFQLFEVFVQKMKDNKNEMKQEILKNCDNAELSKANTINTARAAYCLALSKVSR